MYTTALAFSYACLPSSTGNKRRTFAATVIFALGGIVGWPFALALSIPFIFEELFVYGADTVTPENWNSWFGGRVVKLVGAGLAASLIFVRNLFPLTIVHHSYLHPKIPVIGIDSLAYGKLAIVPWNIIRYNIFGGSERGPTLYGTEPWHFYIKNLFLNFNVLVFFALFSLPALAVTYFVDRKRLGFSTPSANQSSPFILLGLRLAPLYVWLSILTLQPHKEERFMFPAYPLVCFNAAVCLYLARGWLETAYVSVTKSPYRASIINNFIPIVFININLFLLGLSNSHFQQVHTLRSLLNILHLTCPHSGTMVLLSLPYDRRIRAAVHRASPPAQRHRPPPRLPGRYRRRRTPSHRSGAHKRV